MGMRTPRREPWRAMLDASVPAVRDQSGEIRREAVADVAGACPFVTPDHCDLTTGRSGAAAGALGAGRRASAREGHLVDALAPRGDEGRGTLRKAQARGERPVTLRSPNGATHRTCAVSFSESIAGGGEPGELNHLSSRRKGHQHETPQVVASERGPGQWPVITNRKRLERRATDGDSPVRVRVIMGPRVGRGTGNPVRTWGDHPPSLSTPR
jgi:hypothetical protein